MLREMISVEAGLVIEVGLRSLILIRATHLLLLDTTIRAISQRFVTMALIYGHLAYV